MSQAHIEQFYAIASKDQAMFAKMMEGVASPENFVTNAVKVAKEQGFDFSYAEADAWVKKQIELKAGGELSDTQLEQVAGGKNSAQQNLSAAGRWLDNNFGTKPGQGLNKDNLRYWFGNW